MAVKELAEAIILQSVEDLWDRRYREESKDFFSNGGFQICSKMAGLDEEGRSKIQHLVKKVSKFTAVPVERTYSRRHVHTAKTPVLTF